MSGTDRDEDRAIPNPWHSQTVEQLLRGSDADERPVLELSLQGWTAAEISLQLGRALRTVQRLREQVRKRLELMQSEP